MSEDLRSCIPVDLQRGRQVATRHLHHGLQVGRVTVLFRHHDGSDVFEERILPDRFGPLSASQIQLAADSRALNLACSGRARLGPQPVTAGDIFIGSKGLRAETGFLECSLNVDGLTGKRLDELGCWPQLTRPLAHRQPRELCAAFVALFNNTGDPALDPASVLRRGVYLLDLIAAGVEAQDVADDFAKRAQQVLSERCESGFTLHEAAALFDMPYDRFRRQFKHLVGLSPGDYQLRQRMLRACELLPQMSVGACAQRLGYSEASAFSRQFKQITGLPPSRYDEVLPDALATE